MTKEEFKRLWESNDDGGDISYDDIFKCYEEWGCGQAPIVLGRETIYAVLKAAGTVDAEEYKP